MPDDQLAALERVSKIVNGSFARDLAAGGGLSADHAAPGRAARFARDGNLDTWWEAAAGRSDGTLTLTLPKAVKFDVVSLQEAVDHRSQRIESFVIEPWNGSAWVEGESIDSDALTTVGHRQLIRPKSPVTTNQVPLCITGARLEPTLAEIGLYKQAAETSILPADDTKD